MRDLSRDDILVVSTTDFQHFRRCRKLFDYSYVRGLSPVGNRSEAMQLGSDFHAFMAQAARERAGHAPYEAPGTDNPMYAVADAYAKHKPLPLSREIIMAEEPIYTLLLPSETHPNGFGATQEVWLRTTLDLVYTRGTTLVGRDYKTFGVAPSMDVDLDFQGSLYSTVLAKHFPFATHHEFEWEYVRRELGRELGRGAARTYTPWPLDDLYYNVSRVMNDIEMETTWADLQDTARDLVRALAEKRFYRQDLKSGPHSCENCQYNALCKAEFSQGPLTEGTLSLLVTETDPAERASRDSIRKDPRVIAAGGGTDAYREYYGTNGVRKVHGYE